MAILPDLRQMSREQLEAMILAQAKSAERKITMKVSEKGGLSVYGLGRFPITLYRSQWERLLGSADAIAECIKANHSLLAMKE